MIELIPALLCASRREFENKIRTIESFAGMVQIDVLDGTWLPEKNWADPELVAEILSPLHFEIHLMVENPILYLSRWSELPSVRRVIFHIEPVTDPKHIIEAIRFYGREVGIALSPRTPLEAIADYVPYVDEVLFLTVEPGGSGRPFVPEVVKKISAFSRANPLVPIAVDGGLSTATIPDCIAAGATRLVVNSSLFSAKVAPADAWRHMKEVAARA